MKVLIINGGSSGLKVTLCELPASSPPPPLWDAHVDWGRHPGKASVRIETAAGAKREWELDIASPEAVLAPVLDALGDLRNVDVIGHRVVHGGRAFRETTRITPEVKAEIAKLAHFAPEHNRLELEAIEAAERVFPGVPQVAVFDTAFHSTLPEAAYVYPGPYGWLTNQGIRRYGFHGISHQYTSRRAAEMLGRDGAPFKVITCHLGNGASLAAVRDGRSIDTTMGFTPLEGLMMGTRSGTIDPGIVIHLVRNCAYSADKLDQILNKDSGLKGVSGLSQDMREIVAAMNSGNERAKLAFDVYIHRLCREIGSMLPSLGGLDALVFTAGIGENSAPVREAVCSRFAFLGVKLDPKRSACPSGDCEISTADSSVRVLVIRTEEDWEIARECYRIYGRSASGR